MLARVKSGTLLGIDAVIVDVEVDMSLGMPFFNVVGLPDGAVKESKVRVVSALKNADFVLPQKRVVVNLAPADLKKEGATFELPIALGVLASAELLSAELLTPWLVGGELSLDGAVKPIRGVLSLALAARNHGYRGVIVPRENAAEAALVDSIDVIGVSTIQEAVAHLTGEAPLQPHRRGVLVAQEDAFELDFSEVRGQGDAKAALEVAAAGGHNVLLCGPPGSGKTMLARRMNTILPAMTFNEALEVTKVYSVLGHVDRSGLVSKRPFRAPHHTISDAGLVGGGPMTRPGELSMAHRGVLFLDELPEFRRNVLEVLRQPIEEGIVRLARANHHVAYPCNVMLVAAMNPCPCGFYKVAGGRVCSCSKQRVLDYHARISGPLLDRIDITLETRPVPVEFITCLGLEEKPSSWYRARVEAARARQAHRFRKEVGVYCNAQMGPRLLRNYGSIPDRARRLLESAVLRFGLSARAHDRILKLARTRADLEDRKDIRDDDVTFSIGCRALDRKDYLFEAHSLQVPGRP